MVFLLTFVLGYRKQYLKRKEFIRIIRLNQARLGTRNIITFRIYKHKYCLKERQESSSSISICYFVFFQNDQKGRGARCGIVLLQSFGLLIVAGFALIMPHITTHSHNILAKIPENWMTSLSFFQRSCLPHDHTILFVSSFPCLLRCKDFFFLFLACGFQLVYSLELYLTNVLLVRQKDKV